MLKEEKQWATPTTFNPQHFLDHNGNFKKNSAFMPFSAGRMHHDWFIFATLNSAIVLRIFYSLPCPLFFFFTGKRACVGESLARMEIFIFMVSLLRHFTFSCSEGPDSISLIPEYSGFANLPRRYQIIATPRWKTGDSIYFTCTRAAILLTLKSSHIYGSWSLQYIDHWDLCNW